MSTPCNSMKIVSNKNENEAKAESRKNRVKKVVISFLSYFPNVFLLQQPSELESSSLYLEGRKQTERKTFTSFRCISMFVEWATFGIPLSHTSLAQLSSHCCWWSRSVRWKKFTWNEDGRWGENRITIWEWNLLFLGWWGVGTVKFFELLIK